jgi:hypothetical protein
MSEPFIFLLDEVMLLNLKGMGLNKIKKLKETMKII